MLRATTDQCLRLWYRTLFSHGFGPAFGFASGGRNKPYSGSICERKQENVIGIAGTLFSWFARHRNETRPLSLTLASSKGGAM